MFNVLPPLHYLIYISKTLLCQHGYLSFKHLVVLKRTRIQIIYTALYMKFIIVIRLMLFTDKSNLAVSHQVLQYYFVILCIIYIQNMLYTFNYKIYLKNHIYSSIGGRLWSCHLKTNQIWLCHSMYLNIIFLCPSPYISTSLPITLFLFLTCPAL